MGPNKTLQEFRQSSIEAQVINPANQSVNDAQLVQLSTLVNQVSIKTDPLTTPVEDLLSKMQINIAKLPEDVARITNIQDNFYFQIIWILRQIIGIHLLKFGRILFRFDHQEDH